MFKKLFFLDEFGIRIPKFHKNDEIVKKQLMYYGPEIPEELWIKPQKPIGFFGKNNCIQLFHYGAWSHQLRYFP